MLNIRIRDKNLQIYNTNINKMSMNIIITSLLSNCSCIPRGLFRRVLTEMLSIKDTTPNAGPVDLVILPQESLLV